MKKYLIHASYIFILFLLEVAAAKVFSDGRFFIPQLLLLVVIAISLMNRFKYALWYAFFAGFLLEFFSSIYFGGFIFSYTLTALIIYTISRNYISSESRATLILAVVGITTFATPLFSILYHLILTGFEIEIFSALRSIFPFSIFLQLLVNMTIFYPIKRLSAIVFE